MTPIEIFKQYNKIDSQLTLHEKTLNHSQSTITEKKTPNIKYSSESTRKNFQVIEKTQSNQISKNSGSVPGFQNSSTMRIPIRNQGSSNIGDCIWRSYIASAIIIRYLITSQVNADWLSASQSARPICHEYAVRYYEIVETRKTTNAYIIMYFYCWQPVLEMTVARYKKVHLLIFSRQSLMLRINNFNGILVSIFTSFYQPSQMYKIV